jgi:hypothetical protein
VPGVSPRVNSRSRTLSSRRCSEVNCTVVPFGRAQRRRSRTTYRPTVTPEGSTHVDTAFTGTTSSFSRTALGRLATAAVVGQRVFAEAGFSGQKVWREAELDDSRGRRITWCRCVRLCSSSRAGSCGSR